MDSLQQENPYESPVETADTAVLQEGVLRRARLAWMFPRIGFLLFVASNFVTWFPLATSLGFFLLLATIGCWLAGLAMTLYALLASWRYPAAIGHGWKGLASNVLMSGMIFFSFVGYAYFAGESHSSAINASANAPSAAKP